MLTPDDELLRGQYRALAKDLRRWSYILREDVRARQVADVLTTLADSVERKADQLEEPPC